jgi:FkbM family methyltransferase
LWDHDEDRDFYVYAGLNGSGSSFFPQNLDYVRENFADLRLRGPSSLAETWFDRSQVKGTQRVHCMTLDGVLAELNMPFPYHVLKIDCQGAESRILAGAEEYLKRDCMALHLELFDIPLYEGIELLPNVGSYLAGFGFELAYKFPAHGTFDSQHDCLFLKRDDHSEVGRTIRHVYGLTQMVA